MIKKKYLKIFPIVSIIILVLIIGSNILYSFKDYRDIGLVTEYEDFNILLPITGDITYQGSPVGVGVLIHVVIVGSLRVNLSIENCPPNSTCSLNQTIFTQNGTALLRILPTINTPPGIHYITVRAVDNRSISKTATLTLYVYEAPKPIPSPIEDFNISISPRELSVTQGQSVFAKINITIIGPLRVDLSLEGCPINAKCSLDKTIFTASDTATLTIFASDNTPVGTYDIVIKAIDNRSISKTATLTLYVYEAPKPIYPPPIPPEPIPPELIPYPTEDFNISLSQNYLKLVRNSEKAVEVYIKIVGNITVNLSIENCPPNSTCSLNQTTFTSSGTAILTISSLAPVGDYTIKLVGRAKNITKKVNLTLSIVDFNLILPESIDINIGEEKTFEILLKRYGILDVEVLLYCPSGISCIINKIYQKDYDVIYSILLKAPLNISAGKYVINIKAIAENVVRSYTIGLNVLEPITVPKTPDYDRKIISPTLPRAGISLLRERDIIDINQILEIREFVGYKPEIIDQIDYVETAYYEVIKLEEGKIIKQQPVIIKAGYLLNIAILLLVIIICVEILIILKKKLINV